MTQPLTLSDIQSYRCEVTRRCVGLNLSLSSDLNALVDWALGESPAKAAQRWDVDIERFRNIIAKTSRERVRSIAAKANVDLLDVARLACAAVSARVPA